MPMTSFERRATFGLGGIYFLRMLGPFMVLPVLAVHVDELAGATPTLIGFAMGAYGLTMALFQVPFGIYSDRYGRKPVIALALALLAIGSIVAALADSVWMMILGRALQGAGALGAAMMALVADLTREEQRTKAMAVLGMSIGASFMLALVVGPMLNHWMGVAGIFWLNLLLALVCAVLLFRVVPDPKRSHSHRDVVTIPGKIRGVLADRHLQRLNIGILIQHGIIMAMFTALPFVLRDELGFASGQQAWFYLPVLLLSVLAMGPLVMASERRRKTKEVFLVSVALVGIGQLLLGLQEPSVWFVGAALALFFAGFNTLEATLPSLISRQAPADARGTAMGIYSMAQFFGVFLGGLYGGWAYGHFGLDGVFYGCSAAALLWFVVAYGMVTPPALKSFYLHVGDCLTQESADCLGKALAALPGVHEAVVAIEDGTAYLKVAKEGFDAAAAEKLVAEACRG